MPLKGDPTKSPAAARRILKEKPDLKPGSKRLFQAVAHGFKPTRLNSKTKF